MPPLALLKIYKLCKNISPPDALATLNVKTSQIRSGCLQAPISSRHFTVQCQFNFCDEARIKEGRLLYLCCMCMSFSFLVAIATLLSTRDFHSLTNAF